MKTTILKITIALGVIWGFAQTQAAIAQNLSTEKAATHSLNERWELTSLEFEVYPNPSQGAEVSLKAKGCRGGKVTFTLYNTIGGKVWEKQVSVDETGEVQVKLSPAQQAFTRGLYFVSISDSSQRTMKKLIIN